MKALIALIVFLLAASASQAQTNTSDILTTPSNIQYGRSCGDSDIYFWMNAPKRNEWLKAIIEIGRHDGVALIGLGFIKYKTLIGYSHNKPCWLLVSPSWFIPMQLAIGRGHKYLFKMPNDPTLKGLPLFAQAMHVDANKTLRLSRGIQMSVR